MIRFEQVSVRYADTDAPVLHDVNLVVPEGELCLVLGRTGSGKSTLLRCVNGLVPHFTGGTLTGRVTVAGRDTRTHPPRELADVVGVVPQDPLAGFVTDTVEDELAYGMESLGVAPAVMRRRVEETLDLLGLAELRTRPLLSLSAGQQQRVAIGAVLTTHPQVLVLDEPTSALDPPAAEEVLAALTRLVHDLGLTVLVAEHRLERVVQYADRVIHVPGRGLPVEIGAPADILRAAAVAPPVVELGRWAGWSPLPLSVREARRHAEPLRARLAQLSVPGRPPTTARTDKSGEVQGLVVEYGDLLALRGIDLEVRRGEVAAVMGRNGAGKSTLLRALVGLQRPSSGTVRVRGRDPRELAAGELVCTVGYVPQEPSDLLWSETVEEECTHADEDTGASPGTAAGLLAVLAPDISPAAHPRDLSEGQRLALALAVVLAGDPPLLLLDEPTRGLDYGAKRRLTRTLRELASAGTAVLLATHDVELVAELADRVVVLADGELVTDGPTIEVVCASPAFAPQVAKVMAPLQWLTVDSIAKALAG
ncbi:MAG: energy-coupling factor transport system ATP-binding protein [Frankiaceae bacterium]|nr:energy-coupling factor transport system ATP-binding protein [Frankiaceae bacterium]